MGVEILHKVTLHTIVDTTTTAATIYIGKADHGVATSAAEWFIKKIVTTSGANITSVGTDFDQVWDDRASLTYT